MGMFDSVIVNCPYCNKKTELQSKAGDCNLEAFALNDMPLIIGAHLASGGGYRECNHCEKEIRVVANGRPIFTAETIED